MRRGYRLTPKARLDLRELWLYSKKTWSRQQADTHQDGLVRVIEVLASMPTMAREHTEFTPPIRLHLTATCLIVYRVEEEGIVVLRVLGGQQDWRSLLRSLDS